MGSKSPNRTSASWMPLLQTGWGDTDTGSDDNRIRFCRGHRFIFHSGRLFTFYIFLPGKLMEAVMPPSTGRI